MNFMSKSIFLIWQDVVTRMWHPVGKLSEIDGGYRFNYTNGARNPRFKPFLLMGNLKSVYESEKIFPFFANRVVSPERREYMELLEWSGLTEDDSNLELMARTGGRRGTDNFRIIPCPEVFDGSYNITFFVSGVAYISEDDRLYLRSVPEGAILDPYFEDENEADKNAIMLKYQGRKIGYFPRYFSPDIRKILSAPEIESYDLILKKNNHLAPLNYRLLCSFRSIWPEGFQPFISEEYLAISK